MNNEKQLNSTSNLIALRKLHRSANTNLQTRKTRSSSTATSPFPNREKQLATVSIKLTKGEVLPALNPATIKIPKKKLYRSKSVPTYLPSHTLSNDWDTVDIFDTAETGILAGIATDNEALVVVQEMKNERKKKKSTKRTLRKMITQHDKFKSSSDSTGEVSPSTSSHRHSEKHATKHREKLSSSTFTSPDDASMSESTTTTPPTLLGSVGGSVKEKPQRVSRKTSFGGGRDKVLLDKPSIDVTSSSPLPMNVTPVQERPKVARRISLGLMKSHSVEGKLTDSNLPSLFLSSPRSGSERKSDRKSGRKKNRESEKSDKKRNNEEKKNSSTPRINISNNNNNNNNNNNSIPSINLNNQTEDNNGASSGEFSVSTQESISSPKPKVFSMKTSRSETEMSSCQPSASVEYSNSDLVVTVSSSDRSQSSGWLNPVPSSKSAKSSSDSPSPNHNNPNPKLLIHNDELFPLFHRITVEELHDYSISLYPNMKTDIVIESIKELLPEIRKANIEIDAIFKKQAYVLAADETHRMMLSRKFGKPVLNKYSDCIHLQSKEFYREQDELEGATKKGILALMFDVSQNYSYRLHLFLAHPHFISSEDLAIHIKEIVINSIDKNWEDEETGKLFYGLINSILTDWVTFFAVELSKNQDLALLILNILEMNQKALSKIGDNQNSNNTLNVSHLFKRQTLLLKALQKDEEPFSLTWMKPPDPKISKQIKQLEFTFTWSRAVNSKSMSDLNILDFHPDEFARQLTLIDHRMLFQLPLTELQMNNYAKEHLSPTLHLLMDRFNYVVRWIGTLVCCNPNPKERRKIIAYFIIVAVKLLALQNYHGLMQVFVGLTQHPVSRMKESWSGISNSLHDTWKKIETICSPLNNFKYLRNQMLRQNFPMTIPSTLFVKDLTFLEDGNTLFCENTDDKYFNLYRIGQVGQFLECLKITSSVFYELKEVLLLKSFLKNCKISSQKEIEDSSNRHESTV